MEITWNTKLYCLIGKPIDKSLSPIIHNNIFKILNKDSLYLGFNIEETDLKTTINGFKAMKIEGFNVTIPYKKSIIKYLDDITPEAKAMGAVNTVKNHNGRFIGYNTDGDGFLQTFHDNNIDIKGKNILLIGAGGAAYAIANALVKKDIYSITIANRTLDNSFLLQKKIKKINDKILIEITNLNLDNIDKKNIDIIINSTSIGMYPLENMAPLELSGFSTNTIAYDIVYKPYETKLIKEAKVRGMKSFNGISMLLNQAIFSQNIWGNLDKKINLEIFKKIEGILTNYIE
ncbi:shikimate dehydrogenase [uncultured Tissierella sp.]|uniref:shikimate dehydrogenase n=1 Tax=uncultured Tissierella sp. TaxID=448160 RepID=UPI0028057B34|nr:shikimate dehydrogenase [uncultured Tissierella sp.]MDU5080052.1 shikimate dehydrogenase [Bacillota bacterium]